MQVVVVLIAVAVLGLAALVAAGRFGEMQAEPVRDTYRPPIDADTLTGADLEGVRFAVAPLGYDMREVDEFVARMARELDRRDAADQLVTTAPPMIDGAAQGPEA